LELGFKLIQTSSPELVYPQLSDEGGGTTRVVVIVLLGGQLHEPPLLQDITSTARLEFENEVATDLEVPVICPLLENKPQLPPSHL
jgi:hypothetical protein